MGSEQGWEDYWKNLKVGRPDHHGWHHSLWLAAPSLLPACSCYCQFWTKDCSLELGALGSSLLQAPLAEDFIPAAEVERETGSVYLSFVSVNSSARFFKLQTARQDWPLLFVLLWQTQQGPPGEGMLLDTEPLTEMSSFWRNTFPPHASPGFPG